MTDSMVDFSSFSSVYWRGSLQLRNLEQDLVMCSSPQHPPDYTKINDTANELLHKLRESDYGRVLYDSTYFCPVLNELEVGLSDLIFSMLNPKPEPEPEPEPNSKRKRKPKCKHNPLSESQKAFLRDCLEPHRAAVRAFHFWGRAGGVFARYREIGRHVSKEEFTQTADSIHSKTDALIHEIEQMFWLGLFQAVYPAEIVKRTETFLERLYAFDVEFSKANLPRYPERHRRIFNDDYRSIARQFNQSMGLMCFELFGHLRPQTLHRLLDMKVSTAEQLGLIHWKKMAEKIKFPIENFYER